MKLKQKKNSKEIVLFAAKVKGKCCNYRKQGHKLVDCQVNSNMIRNEGAKEKDGT